MTAAAMQMAEKKVRASIIAGMDASPVFEASEHVLDRMSPIRL
jgi:hypothetical protein